LNIGISIILHSVPLTSLYAELDYKCE